MSTIGTKRKEASEASEASPSESDTKMSKHSFSSSPSSVAANKAAEIVEQELKMLQSAVKNAEAEVQAAADKAAAAKAELAEAEAEASSKKAELAASIEARLVKVQQWVENRQRPAILNTNNIPSHIPLDWSHARRFKAYVNIPVEVHRTKVNTISGYGGDPCALVSFHDDDGNKSFGYVSMSDLTFDKPEEESSEWVPVTPARLSLHNYRLAIDLENQPGESPTHVHVHTDSKVVTVDLLNGDQEHPLVEWVSKDGFTRVRGFVSDKQPWKLFLVK